MSGYALTSIDFAILAIIGVSAVIGLVRGLIREVLSLIVWLGAYVLAMAYSGTMAQALATHIDHPAARFVAGFAMIFFGVVIAGAIAQWIIGKLIETSGLSGMDRLLGFVFGGARGVVLCIVAMAMLRPYAGTQPWWRTSVMIDAMEPFEALVLNLFDETAAIVRGLKPVY